MKVDVVNTDNKKVGSLELNDEVFGGRVNDALIWESVVHTNASARRGTHKTKNRANVSGGGTKPWKQKGTGRARVAVDPQAAVAPRRHGVRAAAAQLRLPSAAQGEARRDRRGAGAADQDGALVVVDALSASESKTKAATELLKRLGADGKALLIDVQPDEKLGIAVRNLPGVQFLPSARVGARDVMNASQSDRDARRPSKNCRTSES